MSSPEVQEHYSYRDYLSWPEGERTELIDGVAWAMSPAPRREHQRLVSEFNRQIANALQGHPCEVYPAPFDVKLSSAAEDDHATVVQPDLIVVCDGTKLTDEGMTGAPDLVVEIVSPGSGFHDRGRKYDLYRRHGVREYWIVDPDERVVEVHRLESGRYERIGVFGPEDTLTAESVPAITVTLQDIFPPG
ncbi:MAG: Uma2 family endonuclease [Spirochaetaceae bacterium]|nr:MAG: Uma2 family endonuclease [Spirochaetaceae bacterium]